MVVLPVEATSFVRRPLAYHALHIVQETFFDDDPPCGSRKGHRNLVRASAARCASQKGVSACWEAVTAEWSL